MLSKPVTGSAGALSCFFLVPEPFPVDPATAILLLFQWMSHHCFLVSKRVNHANAYKRRQQLPIRIAQGCDTSGHSQIQFQKKPKNFFVPWHP
jgi:hypothetical protein